jgi:hypothetical protein
MINEFVETRASDLIVIDSVDALISTSQIDSYILDLLYLTI